MFQTTLHLLLQLSALLSLAAAAPVTAEGHHAQPWHYGAGGGVAGFIVLVLDIIVFLEVLPSNRPVPNKVLWCLLVFLFPIGGVIIYFLFSNRAAHRTGYETIG